MLKEERKKKKEDEQFGGLATFRVSTLPKVFGNFGGLPENEG